MYASVEQLRLRLGDLFTGLYLGVDGTPMDAEAAADLTAASAEIDGMIGVRYVVPARSDAALPLLGHWALTLAEELAWSRSGKPELPKSLQGRVAGIRSLLAKVSSGEMCLPGAEESQESGIGGALITQADPPVFTREGMKGF